MKDVHSIVKPQKYKDDYICILAIIALEVFFFRNVIGNSNLFGDIGDGRLAVLLTEHWFRFFTGKEKFADLAMLYPYKGTLGFSDMFLGFGIISSIFRFFGCDMYTAYKLTLILLHIFGSFSMYFLLRKKFSINAIWSLFGVIAFFHSTTFATQAASHTQLSYLSILPLLAILLANIIRDFSNQKVQNKSYYTFIILYVLIIYTGWYVAFFTTIFLLIFFTVYLCTEKAKGNNPLNGTLHLVSVFRFSFIKYFLFTITLLIPFLVIYLPILKVSDGYTWTETFSYLPELADILNTGSENLLLGNLMRKLEMSGRGELEEGMSFILFCLFIYALFFSRKTRTDNIRYFSLINVLSISCVIGYLLVIRLSNSGLSMWYFIWKLIPGGKAIRAAARFMFFLSMPVSIVVSVYGNDWQKKSKTPRLATVISLSLLILLLLTQIRTGGVFSRWNSREQQIFVNSVPNQPSECKAFFITNSVHSDRPSWAYMMDAYEIATHKNVPTMNGYSGGTPADWKLSNIFSDDYLYAVDFLISKNNLDNIYRFDLSTKTWYPHVYSPLTTTRERVLKFDGKYIKGGQDTNGTRFIEPSGKSWGPYWTVFPGKYKVIMTGRYLKYLKFEIYSHLGDMQYPFTYSIEDNEAIFNFEIQEAVQDFELFIKNESDRTASITSCTLIKQEDYK